MDVVAFDQQIAASPGGDARVVPGGTFFPIDGLEKFPISFQILPVDAAEPGDVAVDDSDMRTVVQGDCVQGGTSKRQIVQQDVFGVLKPDQFEPLPFPVADDESGMPCRITDPAVGGAFALNADHSAFRQVVEVYGFRDFDLRVYRVELRTGDSPRRHLPQFHLISGVFPEFAEHAPPLVRIHMKWFQRAAVPAGAALCRIEVRQFRHRESFPPVRRTVFPEPDRHLCGFRRGDQAQSAGFQKRFRRDSCFRRGGVNGAGQEEREQSRLQQAENAGGTGGKNSGHDEHLYCKGPFEQDGRNCLLSRVDIAWGVECKP